MVLFEMGEGVAGLSVEELGTTHRHYTILSTILLLHLEERLQVESVDVDLHLKWRGARGGLRGAEGLNIYSHMHAYMHTHTSGRTFAGLDWSSAGCTCGHSLYMHARMHAYRHAYRLANAHLSWIGLVQRAFAVLLHDSDHAVELLRGCFIDFF